MKASDSISAECGDGENVHRVGIHLPPPPETELSLYPSGTLGNASSSRTAFISCFRFLRPDTSILVP